MTRIILLCLCLCACASSNSIKIEPQAEPIEIGQDSLSINSSLLGLEGRSVIIDTSRNNDVGVKISQSKPASIIQKSGAF